MPEIIWTDEMHVVISKVPSCKIVKDVATVKQTDESNSRVTDEGTSE